MRQGKQQAGRTISTPYGMDGDELAAATVLRIYMEFCEPYARPSLAEIADSLNVDEIPTRRGGRWYPSTVKYILANPVYVDLVGSDTFDEAQSRLSRLRPGPAT
jgi:hypothetical protein